MASHAKSSRKQKKIPIKHSQGCLGASNLVLNQRQGVGLPCVVLKTDLLVGAAKTEVNKVLGLLLTVSTLREESTTSKATVSKEVSVLANSRSNEEAKKPNLTKRSSRRTPSQTLLNTLQEKSEQMACSSYGFP